MRSIKRSTLLLSLLLALVATPAFGRNNDDRPRSMGRKDSDDTPVRSVPEQASTGWLLALGVCTVAFGARWHNKTARI